MRVRKLLNGKNCMYVRIDSGKTTQGTQPDDASVMAFT
jgi:hypothetical protein